MLRISPGLVTDGIMPHVHWDHADGIDVYSHAPVWIQRDECAHSVGESGVSLDRAADALDAVMQHPRHQVARTYTQPLSCATEVAKTPDGCMMMPGSIRLRAFVAAAAGAIASAAAIVSTTS